MESRRHDRSRGRTADIRLGTDGQKEIWCADQFAHNEQQKHVKGHPYQTQKEQAWIVKHLEDVHLHANGGHQYVDKDTSHLGGALTFVVPRLGETQHQSKGSGQNDQPEKPTGQTKACQFRGVRLDP